MFVIEAAVFISEQITECRFGTFLDISDTFSSKLNVFIERPCFAPYMFICLVSERDETFYNGKKCKDKDFNLAYDG